jgi:hypothetical protein
MLLCCSFVVCLLFGVVFANTASLDEKRVHFIDQYRGANAHTNYVFRGNLPETKSDVFQYKELVADLRAKGLSEGLSMAARFACFFYDSKIFFATANVTLPQQFQIVIVKYENRFVFSLL